MAIDATNVEIVEGDGQALPFEDNSFDCNSAKPLVRSGKNIRPNIETPMTSPEPWNLVVEGYEEITRKYLEHYSRSALAMLRYGPETKVIDVACGPGTTTLLLAPAVRHVTCLR